MPEDQVYLVAPFIEFRATTKRVLGEFWRRRLDQLCCDGDFQANASAIAIADAELDRLARL